MAIQSVELNPGSGGSSIGVDVIDGKAFEVVKQGFGDEGALEMVSASNPLPSTDTATQAILASLLAKVIAAPATEAKQNEQIALQETLGGLIITLNSLVNALLPLGSAMNSGAPGLRVTPNAATFPISGSVTATVASTVVSTLTNFGTGIPAKEMADDINNSMVTLANINNVTA